MKKIWTITWKLLRYKDKLLLGRRIKFKKIKNKVNLSLILIETNIKSDKNYVEKRTKI